MDLQAVFSDSQLAVLGCFVALGFCGGIAALSFQFGQAGKNARPRTRQLPLRHPFPQSAKNLRQQPSTKRRAA